MRADTPRYSKIQVKGPETVNNPCGNPPALIYAKNGGQIDQRSENECLPALLNDDWQ